MEKRLTKICSRYRIPPGIRTTVPEPYTPLIPKRWNGVLVLAEAQNHGIKGRSYLRWLKSLPSEKRIKRLFLWPGEVGVHPWDDGSLKLAVEAALGVKAEETAVSNAALWSQTKSRGRNKNPSKGIADHSVCLWKEMLKALRPRHVITAGAIAKSIITRSGYTPLAWRLPSPMGVSRISGLFSETDLLSRYPEVAKSMKSHPEWLINYRKNKIFFACHAVSVSTEK